MSVLIIIVLVLLIVTVCLITMYLFNFFGTSTKKIEEKKIEVDPSKPPKPYTITIPPTSLMQSPPVLIHPLEPSDYRPFSELSEAIEPSILPMAKEDYNRLMGQFFEILNRQSKKLDYISLIEMSDTSLMAQISAKMMPLIEGLKKKYTPQVAGKLLKYFACKHVTILLDNYYTGPPINMVVPEYRMLGIDSFPFTYKSKTTGKVVNASTLAPFKYLSYNIPSKIRTEVSQLYDSIMDRYMDILNNVLKSLPEVNIDTVKSLDVMSIMQNYRSAMEQDFNRIKQLFGPNIAIIVISILKKNILPLLNTYYRGPGIDLTSPPGPNNQVINIKYPNTDKDQIITITSSPVSSIASSQPTISTAPTVFIAPTTAASSQFASSSIATTTASPQFSSSAVATTTASPSSSSSSSSPAFSSKKFLF